MVKLILAGFVPYSCLVLVLMLSPNCSAMVGPIGVSVLEAFWWTYAFIAVAMTFYFYDMPVTRFLSGSVKLQRRLLSRMED